MTKSSVRKIIGDAMWQELGPAVQAAKHSLAGAPGERSEREFLEAVLHLQRTGCPWRDLPPKLGYWHAVYMRFRRWEARGVWQRLWKNLQAESFADARGLLLDSTTVRRPGFGPLSRGQRAPSSTRPPSTKIARSRST